ncbi:YciI family protein [Microvirga puerhi]|uniref:YciI family protein n=1 Tax=Microvirga puerhi TaxID=2876078 RepID=A0ABS7VV02_9HYPH|nr:YciI family protein [Microvirga puerhi]MBZ6078732.1 YciI family protein [Microvirga puerhi]
MPYAIMWDDEPGTEQLRLELREAHLDYMRGNLHRVLASGGLLDDAGQVGTGGLIVLDTDSREEVEAFINADPFFTGGLYRKPVVRRWRKAFYDGKAYI